VPKPAHNLNLKSKPTLGYWNIRGLGAPIRYMLLYCGVEFTDKMYRAGPPPEYDRSEWLDEKFNLGMPFPNLPYLHDEDVKLSETAAIMKYIAGKWKPELLGKDPAVMAELEMLSNYVIQLKITSTMPCYQGKSNQEIMEAVWAPLDQLKEYLGEKEFLTGKNVTWLDFYFFELCMFLDFLSGKIVLEHYPTLGAYCDRFQKLSNFAEHWADDAKTMKWPWNGDMASIGGRGSEL
jgi:glutathione S-transferase